MTKHDVCCTALASLSPMASFMTSTSSLMRLATSPVAFVSCQPISWRSTARRYAWRMRFAWRSDEKDDAPIWMRVAMNVPVAM